MKKILVLVNPEAGGGISRELIAVAYSRPGEPPSASGLPITTPGSTWLLKRK